MRWWAATFSLFLLGDVPAARAQSPSDADARELVDATSEPEGFIREPDPLWRAALFFDRQMTGRGSNEGFHPIFGSMIPGSGWLSAGPGYTKWYANDRVFLDASAAISWRSYKTAQTRIEFPRLARSRLAAGTQVRWDDFTQVSFYGEGEDSRRANRSEYRVRSGMVNGYATVRPRQWVAVTAEMGWLKPSVLARAGTFKRNVPDTRDVFPNLPTFGAEQTTFLRGSTSVTADTRDFPGHPTRGGVVHAAATRYNDQDTNAFSFTQYEAEAARFFPLAGARLVIGAHGRFVATKPGDSQSVPFYLQPSLGGDTSLRSFSDFRFHGRNLVITKTEVRLALMNHLDAALFADAGNVAPTMRKLNLGKRSYGAGLRLHTRRQTFARFDIARGAEGWRVLARMTEPLEFERLSRLIALAPFVP